MMMNLMSLIQMGQRGQNPMGMLQQMAGSNPQINQAMQMLNGKNGHQLKQMAENLAKERGIPLEQIAQSMGLKLPF